MSQEVISMTARDLKRLHLVQQVLERKLRQKEAASLSGCSVRQLQRWMMRVRQDGPQGLIHKLRGKVSNQKLPECLKQKVLMLWQAHYQGFGPTLTQEKLFERNKIRVGRETLRCWLIESKLWIPPRKKHPHRQWRQRKACFGEMLQLDGSHHDWLEGRAPKLVLMALIDDATNRIYARFYDYEGTLPAMDSFLRYARVYGLPQSVYVDRHTTYRSPGKLTIADELSGRERLQSQFERALSELGVSVIFAYSPQAKGRIERLFGILQDRLVKELRLANACSLKEANDFLERYLIRHNHRFSLKAISPTNLHRKLPKPHTLKRILSIRQNRSLKNDNTIQHNGKTYLLKKHSPQTVQVEERLDGKLYLLDKNRLLDYQEIQTRPPQLPKPKPGPLGNRRPHTPDIDHPWRQYDYVQRLKAGKTLEKEDTSKLLKIGHF